MKFTYQFRTSDNVTHSGVVSAPNRDAAFDKIKAQGMKPFALAEAPGALNKIFGKGKRWMAIALLAAISVLLAIALRDTKSTMTRIAQSADRHQIYGDPSLMDEIAIAGFAVVSPDPGERFLAAFAQPGIVVDTVASVDAETLVASLDRMLPVLGDDCREVRELKAIVNGMKDEFRKYLAQGGSAENYVALLRERQQREASIYAKIANELEGEGDDDIREQKNATLRSMGLRTVAKPRRQKVENTHLTPKRNP